jgi:tryptophan-rich sensory protein
MLPRPRRSIVRDLPALTVALLLCFAVAGAGGWITSASLADWYPALKKPSFNPPNAVFGPVWSVLYTLMAVAAWLVWRQADRNEARRPLALFALQLGLNLGWSILFFGLRSPGLAVGEIVILWGAIVATLTAFWRVSAPAGALLVPYIAWVTFAAALNVAIWRLNG